MKILSVFALACLMLAPATACLAQSIEKQACNVEVDVTDTDPKGTNIRAAPGGAVIMALKNSSSDGWISVHVTGQLGDWYEIDRVNLIDADLPPGGKTLFHGKGYLHKSVLGVSGMQNGGAIYGDHDIKSNRSIFMQPAINRSTCSAAGAISSRFMSRRAPAGPSRPAPT
jgi:hypothetical protein